MKVIVSVSGGMDSTTLLAYYLDKGYNVVPISFSYGSKHNKYENEAMKKVCKFFGLQPPQVIHLNFIEEMFSSNLLESGGDIPEGHYTQENMTQTVVPGRNMIFSSIAAGYADSISADIVSLAVHAGDHAIYADCRQEFVESLKQTVELSSENRVTIEAPFIHFYKEDILKTGFSLNKYRVPYELTRTCYKDQEISCGKCGACVERLESFESVGTQDPIEYEKDYEV